MIPPFFSGHCPGRAIPQFVFRNRMGCRWVGSAAAKNQGVANSTTPGSPQYISQQLEVTPNSKQGVLRTHAGPRAPTRSMNDGVHPRRGMQTRFAVIKVRLNGFDAPVSINKRAAMKRHPYIRPNLQQRIDKMAADEISTAGHQYPAPRHG